GKTAEARRVLNRAYEALESQARFLKGRNRLRFLSNLKINRTILAEVAQAGPDKWNQITSMTDSSALTTARSN
ncbi:MAG: hypothetical protein ACREBU_10625, partial [Nitrososphaera sp.]